MRILAMLPAPPGSVYTPEAEQRRLNVMRRYTTAATQVETDYMPANFDGEQSQPGTAQSDMFAGGKLDDAARHRLSAQRAVQAEREGYDAFCPFGTLDYGI